MDNDAEVLTLESALLGGPGLDGYAFQADVYCIQCGREITEDVFLEFPSGIPYPDAEDSEVLPQPIFFGEADSPRFCASCEEYLYGEDVDLPPEKDWDEENDRRADV